MPYEILLAASLDQRTDGDLLLSGYLYTSFASQADYEFVLKYAKELGVVLWENAAKRSFFGSMDGHANIRGFIERRTGSS